MARALARLRCCERSSCTTTTIPLGMCVSRTADSVLFTCWPPAPQARMVSILRSASLKATSTSSAAGSGADLENDVPLVHGVLGDKRQANLLRERVAPCFEHRLFGLRQGAHLG